MIIAASQYTLHLTHDHSSQPYTLHLTHDHIAASQYTQHLTHDHIAPTFDISMTLLLDSNVSDEVRLSAGVVAKSYQTQQNIQPMTQKMEGSLGGPKSPCLLKRIMVGGRGRGGGE